MNTAPRANPKTQANSVSASLITPPDFRIEKVIPGDDLHGSVCWEADVLPASVIEQALDNHIRSWRDANLWRRRDAEIERARKLL